MSEEKSDLEQLKGILPQFKKEDVAKVVEELGIKIPRERGPIELTVEKVGDKLIFQINPYALAKAGSCCNCNCEALPIRTLAANLAS